VLATILMISGTVVQMQQQLAIMQWAKDKRIQQMGPARFHPRSGAGGVRHAAAFPGLAALLHGVVRWDQAQSGGVDGKAGRTRGVTSSITERTTSSAATLALDSGILPLPRA
jgi:hypothetical protein